MENNIKYIKVNVIINTNDTLVFCSDDLTFILEKKWTVNAVGSGLQEINIGCSKRIPNVHKWWTLGQK